MRIYRFNATSGPIQNPKSKILNRSVSSVREHFLDSFLVAFADQRVDVEDAFTFISFFRQNMACVRMAAFEFPLAVERKRFAAPLCVLSFGISVS